MALRLSAAALVFSGFLALASVRVYGTGLLIVPLVLLPLAPVGSFLDKHVYAWRVLRQGLAFTYIFFIPFSLQMFGLLDAVILLVIFIQAYLLLGEKNARVYYELFLMSFFLLLAAVVESPESLIAVALLLYGVSAVWAFATLRMHIEITGTPQRSVPELVALAPESGRLKAGNVFDLGLLLSLGTLSVLSLAITVVVFLFTPRVEAGWLGRRDAQQAVTGLSETVRITGETSIYEDPSTIMHAQFPDETQGRLVPEEIMYWRVTTLPRFSADEWSRRGLQDHYGTGISGILRRSGTGGGGTDPREARRRQRDYSRSIRQVIYMDNIPSQGIPCLDLPYGVRIISDSPYARVSWDPTEDFTLNFDTRGARSLQYEVYSDVIPFTEEELREARFDYRFMGSRDYSLLTYHELLPETQEIARSLTENQPSVYDKVKALERWLSGDEFTYTLNVPALPPENSIDAFITSIKSGHCELYASALALMARSLGIPARVVSGYRGGDYIATDESYLIRASMAHLWVEVLLREKGWVRFDPSPRSDLTPTGLRRMRMAWSSYILRGNMFWYQQVIGFQGGMRLNELIRWPWKDKRPKSPGPLPHEADLAPSEEARAFSYWQLARHRGLQVVVLLSLVAAGAFFWLRRGPGPPDVKTLSRDQIRARKLYLLFLKKASAFGVDCRNKSALEVWDALVHVPMADKEKILSFLVLYQQVRFGGRHFDAELLQKAQAYLKGVKLRGRTG